jgi:two-component system phosphate regulon sensor histidine kinase PhoR
MSSNESDRERNVWRQVPLLVPVVAIAILLGFTLAGLLSPVYGLLGSAAVAVVALFAGMRVRSPTVFAAVAPAPVTDLDAAVTTDLVAVIGAAPIPLILLNPDGVVRAFSEGARALAPALRRGQPAVMALRTPALIESIRAVQAGGQAQRVEFSERVPFDRWYEVFVNPVPSPTLGRPDLLLTFNDLTPLRRAEEMRADFVANASHELRTPLASLSGFIDTLQGPAREDAAARERFLRIMREQARRMARLIDDLLSLSRIELNAHIAPNTPTPLAPIVRHVIDSLQMLARERNVAVELSDAPNPITVRGDRDELVRVFENLIENALKYGGAGGRMIVTIKEAARPGGEAGVSVRDFGPGIAPEHLPRLTERFYRIDVGHSRAECGTGLGLALVKHILNRHRGRLTIESAPGAGATFTAHLPTVVDA